MPPFLGKTFLGKLREIVQNCAPGAGEGLRDVVQREADAEAEGAAGLAPEAGEEAAPPRRVPVEGRVGPAGFPRETFRVNTGSFLLNFHKIRVQFC